MSLADVRDELADYLSGLQATVYTYPPAIVTPPAIVLVYDEPALEPVAIGSVSRLRARYKLSVAVVGLDNEAALEQLEELCVGIYSALPQGITLGAFTKPYMTTIGPSELLVSDLSIAVITQE